MNPLVDAALGTAKIALSSMDEKVNQLVEQEQLGLIKDLQKLQAPSAMSQQLWGGIKDKLLQQIQGKLTAELGGLTQKAAEALGGFGSNQMTGMAMQVLMGKANGIAEQITALVGQQLESAMGSFAGDLKLPIEDMAKLLDEAKSLNPNQKFSSMLSNIQQGLMAGMLNDPTGFVTAPLQFIKNGLQGALSEITSETSSVTSGISQVLSVLQDPSIPNTINLDYDAMLTEVDQLGNEAFGNVETELLMARTQFSRQGKFSGDNLTKVLTSLQSAITSVNSSPNLGLLKKIGGIRNSMDGLTEGLERATTKFEKWSSAANGFESQLQQLDITQAGHPFNSAIGNVLSNAQALISGQKEQLASLKQSITSIQGSGSFIHGSDLTQMSQAELRSIATPTVTAPELPDTVPQSRAKELSGTVRTPAALNTLKARAVTGTGIPKMLQTVENSFSAVKEAIGFSNLTSLAALKNPASILTPGSPIFDNASKMALDTMKSAVSDANFVPGLQSIGKDLNNFKNRKFDKFLGGAINKTQAIAPLQSALTSAQTAAGKAANISNTVAQAQPTVSRLAMNSLKVLENAGFDKAYDAAKTGNWKSLFTMSWDNATLGMSIMSDAATIKQQFDLIKADSQQIEAEMQNMQQRLKITQKNLTSATSLAKAADTRITNRAKLAETAVKKLESGVKLFKTLIKNADAANKSKK